MSAEDIPKAAAALYNLLSPLNAEDRQKVVRGALAMLGEPASITASHGGDNPDDESSDLGGLGPRARRWLKKFSISPEQLEHVFHFDGGTVDLLDIEVPGSSKKLQTINSYMLVGAKQFLATDDPKFDDKSALDYCKRVGCHDTANHAVNRAGLGNKVTGNKSSGFSGGLSGRYRGEQLFCVGVIGEGTQRLLECANRLIGPVLPPLHDTEIRLGQMATRQRERS